MASLLMTPRTADATTPQQEILHAQRRSQASRGTWLHVLSHLDPKYGGLSAVVPQLTSAIADTDRYGIGLTAFCEPGENYLPSLSPKVRVDHLAIPKQTRRNRSCAPDFVASITASSGVHIHGLWQRSTALAASLARENRKPYLVSAHGMLEPWALANKRWKKKLYLALVEKANLQGAACLHALTGAEAEDYRRIGLRNPIAIIPNGVMVPAERSKRVFLERFPALSNKRLILFLGRIHFKKGLDILCEAWSRIAAEWPEAQLVLAGPDFEGTQAKLERMLTGLKLASRVTWTGMLAGDDKWSALAAAEFFVLPSYSEGLSVSTLEALGMSKPVLITENCHLPEVTQQGCGLVIKGRADDLAEALQHMLSMPASRSAQMGLCGENLVRTRYGWQVIGRQMADVYTWLEGGPQPTNVEIHFDGEPCSAGEQR